MNKSKLLNIISRQVRKNRSLVTLFKQVARQAAPDTVVLLEYPINSRPRWDQNKPHDLLYKLIDKNRETYRAHLKSFLTFADDFGRIPERHPSASTSVDPFWLNPFMPALDAIALYSFIALNKPKYFMEVGSGNSTKFARKVITDHKLNTRIISIDPHPRAEIDQLCDEIIREPLENVDLKRFDVLGPNDILFVDSSHRVFMNSDVTALFLDVFPRLRPGVLIEVHDIALPFDYPADWSGRFFSEQYLLAAYLLAGGNQFEVVLPNWFICSQAELHSEVSPLLQQSGMKNLGLYGASFWMRTK